MPDQTPPDQFTLEELARQQLQGAAEEDKGVTDDEELDQARILDEALLDTSETLPSERAEEVDSAAGRGGTRVDDEVRGEKRKQQYEDGADFVSELD